MAAGGVGAGRCLRTCLISASDTPSLRFILSSSSTTMLYDRRPFPGATLDDRLMILRTPTTRGGHAIVFHIMWREVSLPPATVW